MRTRKPTLDPTLAHKQLVVYPTSAQEMSFAATRTTRVSPSTLHFCKMQLGAQLWFAKRASLPIGPVGRREGKAQAIE